MKALTSTSKLADRIIDALQLIMDRCDGARMLDGEGYSKFDRPRAEELLDLSVDAWEDEEIREGKSLVRKYRRQLEAEGVDVDSIVNSGTGWGVRTQRQHTQHAPVTIHTCARGAIIRPALPILQTLPPPATFDLPEKFTEWRHDQDRAVLRALDSPKRFVVLALPTGAGKSLVYMAAAKLSGKRTAFLTATKNLQAQLIDDFHTSGLVDIRGANNYECVESHDGTMNRGRFHSCDHGYCKAGIKCEKQSSGCLYFDQVRVAKHSSLVVTNYAYWMNKQAQDEGATLGDFDMLVMDEAHDSVDELCSYLSVEIARADVESLAGGKLLAAEAPLQKWIAWANELYKKVAPVALALRETLQKAGARGSWRVDIRHLRALEKLRDKLGKIAGLQGEWVCDVVRSGSQRELVAKFDPVWPAKYAEDALFYGIKKVILTSATIRPKTLELLGIKPEDVDFVDYPSVFPKERRPVIHVPSVRVDKNIDAGDRKLWVSKIDAIIRARTDRKGIIHTVSYERARYIFENSNFRDYMLMHETRTARDVMEVFKRGDAPLILLSPSMTTGVDFPYDQCRYQIIAKIPFPDTRNKVMAARTKEDATYGHFIAMQTLVQMCGRGMRAADDLCENLIVDDHAKWFIPKWREFAPKWFMESYTSVNIIPNPI